MAEITSGTSLTVIVLNEEEARLLADHLGPVPTFPSHEERSRLKTLIDEITEAVRFWRKLR